MTQDRTFHQVGSTLPSPGKHVVGVFDSLQEGEQAVQEPSRHLWMLGIMRKMLRSSPVKIFLQLSRSACGRKGFFGGLFINYKSRQMRGP
jgi:hypothetical protein